MFKNRQVEIPLVFNGYPVPFMVNICKVAQDILNEINPKEYNPTPFVKKNTIGCEAIFKTNAMAEKVEEIMRDVATQDFPIDSYRIIEICFHIAIEGDLPENFIYFIEKNTFFICHSKPGYAEYICERMKSFFDRHIFQLPAILISDLIEFCNFPLKQDERLIISCGKSTFLIPMVDKEETFFKEFDAKIERIKEIDVDCCGIHFSSMKHICSEIAVKGVFYTITHEHVKLTGLSHSLKNFSEILKRRIKEHIKDQQTKLRVVSLKKKSF
jgi:hypothetical protein